MSRLPSHPTRDQIELPMVLDCLSDPTRLAIVTILGRRTESDGELRCGDFNALSGKSNLAYHFGRLRESGLTQVRVMGTARLVKLRRADLDARFPGLLAAVIAAATRDAERMQLVEAELAAAD
jgi:DNA-binding transcriptional ArsR family regulator